MTLTRASGGTAGGVRGGAGGVGAGAVGRRRALPTGRAVAGAFFIAVAAVAVLAAWLGATRAHDGRGWVVASGDLPVGAVLSPDDLHLETLSLPASGVGAVAFTSPAALAGRVLVAPLVSGELVQDGDLAPPGASGGLRPVTVAVAASDLDDLAPGALVDVLVTDGSDPTAPTTVVVTDARVVSEDRSSDTVVANGTGADVTIGVSSLAQVTAVVHAADTGTLSVVAGAPGDRVGAGSGSGGSGSGGSGSGGSGSGGSGSGTGGSGSGTGDPEAGGGG